MADETSQPDLTSLTVSLLSAFVANNSVRVEELSKLIGDTHAALADLNSSSASAPAAEEAEAEAEAMVEEPMELEAEIGRPCTKLAYPYGEHDGRVRAAVEAAGYERAFALRATAKAGPYGEPRLDLYRRHSPARALLMTTPLHRFAA